MSIRVLVVDDSRFICNRVCEILKEDIDFEIVGVAHNGKEAVLMAAQLTPDVITMDVEMPVMDGITAVKKIMSESPTAILMFSAVTHAGGKATLDALNAGAIDFLPKQLDEIDKDKAIAKRLLRLRVRIVALQANRIKAKRDINKETLAKQVTAVTQSRHRVSLSERPYVKKRKIELLVIVASTGGPVAIQKILPELPSNCLFPILIIQHMPHNFTKSFAERLDLLSNINVKEASNGEVLVPGSALVAPGGKQLELIACNGMKMVKIKDKDKNDIYSPCADVTLASISRVFSLNVLTVILTGMGADGKQGAMTLKKQGFPIWAQDEASSLIYGMPKAIIESNLADKVYSLNQIASQFNKFS